MIDHSRLTALDLQQARRTGAAQALRRRESELAAVVIDVRKRAIAEASRRTNVPISTHSTLQEIATVNAQITTNGVHPPLISHAELAKAIEAQHMASDIGARAADEERAARALDQLLTQCRKYVAGGAR
jgi:hypothetical protein